MAYVIVATRFKTGLQSLVGGLFLRSADVDACKGNGYIDFTGEIDKAQKFLSEKDALEFWKTPSSVKPFLENGKPNRPLTRVRIKVVSDSQLLYKVSST